MVDAANVVMTSLCVLCHVISLVRCVGSCEKQTMEMTRNASKMEKHPNLKK